MPDRSPAAKPADIRAIFGENLARLCKAEPSVAELCRRIGVNRTQFNRYLSGAAFPRPDLLQRICAYFQVDARILLQPLDEIRGDQRLEVALTLRDIIAPPQSRPFDHYLMPDGLYRFWRKSFSNPGQYVSGIWRVYTEDGVKRLKSFDLYQHPLRRGTRRAARKVPYGGLFVQHFDGVSLLCSTGADNVLSFTFFEYGMNGSTLHYTGISTLTRRLLHGSQRVSNIVLERLVGDCGEILSYARKVGIHDGTDIPPEVRRTIDNPHVMG